MSRVEETLKEDKERNRTREKKKKEFSKDEYEKKMSEQRSKQEKPKEKKENRKRRNIWESYKVRAHKYASNGVPQRYKFEPSTSDSLQRQMEM
jgi:hypothetical protein